MIEEIRETRRRSLQYDYFMEELTSFGQKDTIFLHSLKPNVDRGFNIVKLTPRLNSLWR